MSSWFLEYESGSVFHALLIQCDVSIVLLKKYINKLVGKLFEIFVKVYIALQKLGLSLAGVHVLMKFGFMCTYILTW